VKWLTYVVLLIIFGTVSSVSAVVMAMFRAAGRREAQRQADDEPRQLARQFTGVVTERTKLAATFDASYWCGLMIRCDDGTEIPLKVPMWLWDDFPEGSRIAKRAGKRWPEPVPH
jgi:hypothetical protein